MSISKIERIDRFGHCCWCAKNLLTKRVVDGKIVDMFLPDYDHTFFLLNSGSQMQITICKKCKETIDLNDSEVHNELMEAVLKGWELETKMLVADDKCPDWTEEKGKEYLDKMSKLNIHCNSERLSNFDIQNRQFELLKLNVEELKEEK